MNADRRLPHDWFPQPIPANVEIGERSWCYSSFAFLHYRSRRPCGLRVGHDSGIYHGTFFELGPDGAVEIGNYATLVGAIISTNGGVLIGDYAFISHEVVLADSFAARPFGWQTTPPLDSPGKPSGSIVVEETAWIGARAVLLSGAVVGKGAIVGAASRVDFEVPPYGIVAGNPARLVGWSKA